MKRFLTREQIFLVVLLIGLAVGAMGCSDAGFVTPPTQTLGATLNSKAADQHPQLSYNGRYIVFASDRHRQRSIFLYDIQNRNLVSLPGLNQPGSIQDRPDISADGRYIVYVSEQNGKPDIFVYDRSSMKAENITGNLLGVVRNPSISGNGRFVSFESNRSGQWDVEIYDRGLDKELSLPQDLPVNSPNSE